MADEPVKTKAIARKPVRKATLWVEYHVSLSWLGEDSHLLVRPLAASVAGNLLFHLHRDFVAEVVENVWKQVYKRQQGSRKPFNLAVFGRFPDPDPARIEDRFAGHDRGTYEAVLVRIARAVLKADKPAAKSGRGKTSQGQFTFTVTWEPRLAEEVLAKDEEIVQDRQPEVTKLPLQQVVSESLQPPPSEQEPEPSDNQPPPVSFTERIKPAAGTDLTTLTSEYQQVYQRIKTNRQTLMEQIRTDFAPRFNASVLSRLAEKNPQTFAERTAFVEEIMNELDALNLTPYDPVKRKPAYFKVVTGDNEYRLIPKGATVGKASDDFEEFLPIQLAISGPFKWSKVEHLKQLAQNQENKRAKG